MKKWKAKIIGVLLMAVFIIITFEIFEWQEMWRYLQPFMFSPLKLILVTMLYISAFFLRAVAWHMYVQRKLAVRDAFCGISFSLLVNHLLPFKVGEAARIGVAVQTKALTLEESTHSVVILRLLDLLFLGGVTGLGLFLYAIQFSYSIGVGMIALGIVGIAIIFNVRKSALFLHVIRKQWQLLKEGFFGYRGVFVFFLTAISWCLEGAVLFMFAFPLLSIFDAVWINSFAVAGGIFQITPGGIGTYESVMSAGLVVLGVSLKEGYHLALAVHAYKFVFSYVLGVVVVFFYPYRISWRDLLVKGGKRR